MAPLPRCGLLGVLNPLKAQRTSESKGRDPRPVRAEAALWVVGAICHDGSISTDLAERLGFTRSTRQQVTILMAVPCQALHASRC